MALANPDSTRGLKKAVRRWPDFVLPIGVALLLLAGWQFKVIHTILNIQTFQLPLPSQIIEVFGKNIENLWRGTTYTLVEALLGWLIGSTAGFLMALLFVWFDVARRGLMPIAVTTNAIPIIAFAPIMTRWFGFDQPTRIAVVTMMTFAPMVVSAYKGLSALDTNSTDLLESYAANRRTVFFKLRLPTSLPYVFAALKISMTAAIIGAVIAEFFNSAGGIGLVISNNIQSGDFALAWCGVLIVTGLGLLLYLLVSLAERWLVPWQTAYRIRRN